MKRYRDLEADGGSRVVEQIQDLHARIKQRLESVSHILAIGSGKGGVGKSTLVTQIATALQHQGKKVGILDADINGPSQARMAGVQNQKLLPGVDGLAIPRSVTGIPVLSFGSLFSENEVVSFDSVAKGDMHTWRATREFAALAEILASADWGELDVLLVDLPPGAERTQQFIEFLGPAASLVLVSLPSDLARGVVKRSVLAVKHLPNKLFGVIENMAGYYCVECKNIMPLFSSDSTVELTVPSIASIPFDNQLATACDRGGSILEFMESPTTKAILEVSKFLWSSVSQGENTDEVSMCAM